jgi:hypothetical protein
MVWHGPIINLYDTMTEHIIVPCHLLSNSVQSGRLTLLHKSGAHAKVGPASHSHSISAGCLCPICNCGICGICWSVCIWISDWYLYTLDRLTTQMRSHEHLLPFLFEAMRMETNHQHPWDLQHTSAVGMVTFLVSWSSHDPCPVSWWQGVCLARTAHCLPREWAGFPTEKRTGADSCPNWSEPMLGRISCLTILDGEHAIGLMSNAI